MPDPSTLKPDDPTPDPESPVDTVAGMGRDAPKKGTTFVDVAEAAKSTGGNEEPEAVPLGHHTITELRKLLVPVVTAIVTALAAGGFVEWRAGTAKDAAVLEAESRIDAKIKEANEASRELDMLRIEIRKAIIKDASWDDVGTLQANKDAVLRAVMRTTDLPASLNDNEFKDLFRSQLEDLRAQAAFRQRQTEDR